MKKRRIITLIIYIAVLVLAFSWMLGLFGGNGDRLTYSQVVELFRQEQVKSFTVRDQQIELELYAPYDGDMKIKTKIGDVNAFRQEMGALFQSQQEAGILESYHFVPEKALFMSEISVKMGEKALNFYGFLV